MDELEKRRLEKHHQQLFNDEQFEAQLAQTLNVNVEADLAEKILLKQRLGSPSWLMSYKPLFGIAASISLVAFLFFQATKTQLADIALKHVYHELDHLVASDQPVNQDELLASIRDQGFDISSLPSEISYVGRCMIGDEKGIHMVARVDDKPITLFLSNNVIDESSSFSDARFFGEIHPTSKGSYIIVGESIEDLAAIRIQTYGS